jgi:hypothetical protein
MRLLISESRGDLNRCTLYRGNLIHMAHTLFTPVHIRHSYTFYKQFPYVVTFHADLTELDGYYFFQEKVLPTPPLSPAECPALVFLPTTTIDAIGLSQAFVDEYVTSVYWVHISSM